MFGLRMPELLLIFAIVFLLFGASKLPQLGAGLGQAIRGFKKSFDGQDEEKPTAAPTTPPSTPTSSDTTKPA
jgi:sec-independent protein translocase protein TatA